MAMKQMGKKVYKSMQGKTVDMDLLRQRNELTPAVGNAKVNARGDEIGPGGKIVRSREQVLKDYYESSQGMPDELAVKKTSTEAAADPLVIQDNDWVEDHDGNFVKKTTTKKTTSRNSKN